MTSPMTCLVTLHGIGFEHSPQPDAKNSGYADLLHAHLSKCLGEHLSDDPCRTREQRGENGAIYVESRSLTTTGTASREEGLKRLGVWANDMQHIETKDAPLVTGNESVSHVALVYSDLEPRGAEVGASLVTFAMSLLSVSHYAHTWGLIHMALTDIMAMAGSPHSTSAQQADPSAGLLTTLRNLEDDVACYVCHNEERERIRSFVAEALLRLASRDDVEAIVFNTHSNGTVIALDVLRQLPPFALAKIKAFITAGSPLRKYINLFHWGSEIEWLNAIKPWYNFWDERDPVADPLEPPLTWHRGDELASSYDANLFRLVDPNSGLSSNLEVTDIKVDNVHKSIGSGLPAHNYWDNEEQFVRQLADIMSAIVSKQVVKAA